MIIFINFSTPTGFPQLQIALVSNQGFIEAFPIDGLVETFPKLQFKQCDPKSTEWNGECYSLVLENFGVSFDKVIYYLSTNPDINVVKHSLDGGKQIREIGGCKIPNLHLRPEFTFHLQG